MFISISTVGIEHHHDIKHYGIFELNVLDTSCDCFSYCRFYYGTAKVSFSKEVATDARIGDHLNERDAAIIKDNTISYVSKWEAIKDNENVEASLSRVRYDFLLKLYVTSSTLSNPMNMYMKYVARQKMAILYESAKTDDDKALVMQVIAYFELLK